jgi:hypothetical protein
MFKLNCMYLLLTIDYTQICAILFRSRFEFFFLQNVRRSENATPIDFGANRINCFEK